MCPALLKPTFKRTNANFRRLKFYQNRTLKKIIPLKLHLTLLMALNLEILIYHLLILFKTPRTHTQTHTHTHTNKHIHKHKHTYTLTCTHTCTNTHTQTHRHTHAYV